MTGKVETTKESHKQTFLFDNLADGEGVVNNISTRVRMNARHYIQFIKGIAFICYPNDWPDAVTGRKTNFELVAREI